MKINYKRELENAARNMILVHEPDFLIKMIARMIVEKINVRHAGILLHQRNTDSYILNVSRGCLGQKIPAGFIRLDNDSPLIKFFREYKCNNLPLQGKCTGMLTTKSSPTSRINMQRLLKRARAQMDDFNAVLCIPCYFRDELLAVFLMGQKNNSKKFCRQELDFFNALISDVAMAVRNAQLFKDLELEMARKYRLFINTIVTLAAAIDAKDHYTRGHTERVTSLSIAIAKKLSQVNSKILDEKFLGHLHIAGLLHDIGKIGIPETVLNKIEPLSADDWDKIRHHPLLGAEILKPIIEMEEAILGVKYHHERYDGTGYPEGLKGRQIPFIASIIAVADAFDAMTTDRAYRKALSYEDAVQEIKSKSGAQFDPQVVNAFLELAKEGKI